MHESPNIHTSEQDIIKIQSIEKLKNSDISYAIALALNHKYDFGGYSVGRSERSFLLDMYFRLNRESHEHLADLNPFQDGALFVEEAKKRVVDTFVGKKVELDEHNLEDLSCIILRLWIKHYREKMELLSDGGYVGSDVDYSFNSEIERAELLYGLYIQEKDVEENALDDAASAFLNADSGGFNKYTLELGWRVDDLANQADSEVV